MPLKIISKDQPLDIKQLIVALYAPPGVGKSTLAFSANNPLMFDFDHGSHRARGRKDIVEINKWGDVTKITEADLEPYDTIIVDTAGRALDMLTVDIIRRNPKQGRGGSLTLQGYGTLKTEFVGWLNNLRATGSGKDIILIAHASEVVQGDNMIERIDMQGASKNEIYKVADAMGRLNIELGNNLPVLNFDPSSTSFGKNPGQLPPLQIPDIEDEPDFMAQVIEKIKTRLQAINQGSGKPAKKKVAKKKASKKKASKKKAASKSGFNPKKFQASVKKAETLEQINTINTRLEKVPEQFYERAEQFLDKHAASLGFEFDEAEAAYVEV